MEKRKIDQLTNQYPRTIMVRNALKPVGKTIDYFNAREFLEKDMLRTENASVVKEIINDYHRDFIEKTLSNIGYLENLNDYIEEFYGDADSKKLSTIENNLRKEIGDVFKHTKNFKAINSVGQMFSKILPEYVGDDEEKKAYLESFNGFTTYFDTFFTVKELLYSDEDKYGTIANRIIKDNLPKFLNNNVKYKLARQKLSESVFAKLKDTYENIYNIRIDDLFLIDEENDNENSFATVMSQSGIDMYNTIISGFTNEDGTKVQGLNEYVEQYNQKQSKARKIPHFEQLYKQMLTKSTTLSFVVDSFTKDDEVLSAIEQQYTEDQPDIEFLSVKTTLNRAKELFTSLNSYDLNSIYIHHNSLSKLSHNMFKGWYVLQNMWFDRYDADNKKDNEKNLTKYFKKREKEYNKIKSHTLQDIQNLIQLSDRQQKPKVVDYFKKSIITLVDNVNSKYDNIKDILGNYDTENNNLKADDATIIKIKAFLDSVKEVGYLIKLVQLKNNEQDIDQSFYDEYNIILSSLALNDRLYNKVRNYVTQKPFVDKKYKLNFDNASLLSGWDINKENTSLSVLFEKDGLYYLGIIDRDNRKIFENIPKQEENETCYRKMIYKQISDAGKYFSIKQFKPQNPPQPIMDILLKKKKDKNSITVEEHRKLISYIQDDFIPNYKTIQKADGTCYFNIPKKDPNKYEKLQDYLDDISEYLYSIEFLNIPESYIDSLVDNGELYLFQIYNKDYNAKSRGREDLHTQYFKMLFDENNLKDVVYKLNGGATIFYRPASIKPNNIVKHKAGRPIKTKNPHNKKKERVFKYDIIQNYRYTKPQFTVTIPITANYKAKENGKFTYGMNVKVRELIKECDNNYVIGIARGQQHLLYATVVDSKGNIVEQLSLDIINNKIKDMYIKNDYRQIYHYKNADSQDSSLNWKAKDNTKNLIKGYITQVVHKICQLIEKYDAIVVMDDPNNSSNQGSILKSNDVQTLAEHLIKKLNFVVGKDKDMYDNGGLLKAYQLTAEFESFTKLNSQNGFLFFANGAYTSLIDAETGFVNMLKPYYSNVPNAQEFVEQFKSIAYNENENLFEFEVDYKKFNADSVDFKNHWTICTNGIRTRYIDNIPKDIDLTEYFIELFNDYNIDYRQVDLQYQISNQDKKDFFVRFLNLVNLTTQLRNKGKDEDYIISPVRNKDGEFFDTRKFNSDSNMPCNADANTAYSMATKGLWIINQIKNSEEIGKAKTSISSAEWLKFKQDKVD